MPKSDSGESSQYVADFGAASGLGILQAVRHEISHTVDDLSAAVALLMAIVPKTERSRPLFDRIDGNIRSLATLLSRLGDLGRPSTLFDFDVADISELAESAIEMLRLYAEKTHIKVGCCGTGKLRCRVKLVEQVFVSVLMDIMKAAPSSAQERSVEIVIKQCDHEALIDICYGQPDGEWHIYDEWHVYDERPEFSDTDLDLWIVRQMLKELNGSLSISSSNGGECVKIVLPAGE